MKTVDELERLRAQLGEIDMALLEQLKLRLECCVEIAAVKKANGVPMMQPHRIDIVQERAARFAREHGIDPDFLRSLYALIIDETCRIEDRVIGTRCEPS